MVGKQLQRKENACNLLLLHARMQPHLLSLLVLMLRKSVIKEQLNLKSLFRVACAATALSLTAV